ncbi:L-rhamnose mutarotase [Pedobacter sp. L105]|uniref:L-rhamnose mutarotase n=1 Tax=Pedobacter sp. L105 TaxID=1641871 RepID=UPI00131EABA1|nr:L-rhamnose mutarotase [Pedobacter sp. L105]
MKHVAFKMRLKPGMGNEYKRRHDALWPEVRQLLLDSGIREYAIFFDPETDIVFAVHNYSTEQGVNLKNEDVLQLWWDYMADIMDVNPDNSPVIIPMLQVFEL